jgi:hypothetical protein
MDALSSLILWGLFLHGTDGKPLLPQPVAVGIGMQFLHQGMTWNEVEAMLHLESTLRSRFSSGGTLSWISHSYQFFPLEAGFSLHAQFESDRGRDKRVLKSAALRHRNRVVVTFEP